MVGSWARVAATEVTVGDVRCPACGGGTGAHCWTVYDRLFRTTADPFQLRRCGACDVLYLWPPPPESRRAVDYPDGYWGAAQARTEAAGLRMRLREVYRRLVLRDQVRFVTRVVDAQRTRGRPVRLLDIGCGDGSILGGCGIHPAIGLDASPDALRAARADGHDVLCADVSRAPFADGVFSVITLFHVLEHVTSPAPFLAAVGRLLAPDGDLIVQVPNVDSWQARAFGPRWGGLDVPRHVVDYSATTLRATLERNGFLIVGESHFSLRDNPIALANSVAPGLYPPGRAVRGEVQGGAVAWAADLAYLALTLAAMPLAWCESAAGRGAAVMVQARLHSAP